MLEEDGKKKENNKDDLVDVADVYSNTSIFTKPPAPLCTGPLAI